MFKAFLIVIIAFMLETELNAQTARTMVLSDSVQTGWVRQYISGYTPPFDFAYAIDLDASGNIYVTGSSYGSDQQPDFVTIKYNSSGDTLWVRRYNGPGNNWDIARAITIDAAGNVYVAGETYSESTDFNYATIKYDAGGNQVWVVQYNGTSNNDDGALALTVDGSGNVYVTGHSWQAGTSWDYATIKYNSAGVQQWVARYNGPGNIADFAVALGIDPSGNVYVTGTSDDLSVNFFPAYATVKYNSSGVQQWVARYNVLWSYASAIAVDNSGNAYVTGRSYALGTYYDYATVKYNTSGAQQWVSRYNGPGNSDDYATSIAIDGSGNAYVTGEAFFVPNEGSDYATLKYNSSGVQQWVARYNGPASSVDVANDIVVDGAGNVYVTGESRGLVTEDDYATIKYNSSGVEQCIARYNGQGNTFDLASALAVDALGNIYVTGRSTQTGGSIITTIKYVLVPVSVQGQNTEIPLGFSLEQNYPNPFNPMTKIRFNVASVLRTDIKLVIYDITGSEIAVLVNQPLQPGTYEAEWDGSNYPTGIYFYRITAGDYNETKKMMFIK
ncbi:MAG: SBBP repeat-containing protein [Chlorobi bacterium]|nr:SBBP repeat-containing protein [Chlorobiota bacterium]MCI0716042.1 SBBP repeat-containing protein [Chlorobiota bacterium]